MLLVGEAAGLACSRPLRGEHAEDCARDPCRSLRPSLDGRRRSKRCSPARRLSAPRRSIPATPDLRGFVLSRRAADEAEILTIAVAPAWRGYGVGRELLAEHLRQARAAGRARDVPGGRSRQRAGDRALWRASASPRSASARAITGSGDGTPARAWVMRRELA